MSHDPANHPTPAAMARAAYPNDGTLSIDQIGEAAAARLHYAAGARAERVRLLAILTSLDQGDWLLGRLRGLVADVEASLRPASATKVNAVVVDDEVTTP